MRHFLTDGKSQRISQYEEYPVAEASAPAQVQLLHRRITEIIHVRTLVLTAMSVDAQILQAITSPAFVPHGYKCISYNSNDGSLCLENSRTPNTTRNAFEIDSLAEDLEWILSDDPLAVSHNLSLLREHGRRATERALPFLHDVGKKVLSLLHQFYSCISYLHEKNMEAVLFHARLMMELSSDFGFCIASMHFSILPMIFFQMRCIADLQLLINRCYPHRALNNVAKILKDAESYLNILEDEESALRSSDGLIMPGMESSSNTP